MPDIAQRTTIFISHATPEDNEFVRWLGAKLAALGYDVWADLFELEGGADWSRELEDALRHRSIKMLLVCTPSGLLKQGVRNEIQIGSEVGKTLNDAAFIIPLRLAPFQAPFLIAHRQYVDFSRAWAAGLAELVDLLTSNPAIPRASNGSALPRLLASQTEGAAQLVTRRELLVSNWLAIKAMPEKLIYCEPPFGLDLDSFQKRTVGGYPQVPFKNGVLSFLQPDASGHLPNGLPARVVDEVCLTDFLASGWPGQGIERYVANRVFSDLGNQAFDLFMSRLGMSVFSRGQGRNTWWPDIRMAPKSQIVFSWGPFSGRRQIIGQSEKRGVFWHYGLNGQVRDYPFAHIRIVPHLLFSTNGMDVIDDAKKAHRLRRSFASGWRNARWRDMMLAYLWWVASGTQELALPLSPGESLVVSLPPYALNANFSVVESGEAENEEDDPEDEYDHQWDDGDQIDESA